MSINEFWVLVILLILSIQDDDAQPIRPTLDWN